MDNIGMLQIIVFHVAHAGIICRKPLLSLSRNYFTYFFPFYRCSLLGRPFLPRRGAIYCSIACSKGEPPTPSDSSGPGLRPPRQRSNRTLNRPQSDNESSTPPGSPMITPSSPIRQMKSPQVIRSPKMGRRALQQRNPKVSQEQQTTTMSSPRCDYPDDMVMRSINNHPYQVHPGSSAGPSNTSQQQSPMPSPSPVNKGLDRVLLERNLEKLLIDRSKYFNYLITFGLGVYLEIYVAWHKTAAA